MSDKKKNYNKYNAKRLETVEKKGLVKLQAFVKPQTKAFLFDYKDSESFSDIGQAIDEFVKSYQQKNGKRGNIMSETYNIKETFKVKNMVTGKYIDIFTKQFDDPDEAKKHFKQFTESKEFKGLDLKVMLVDEKNVIQMGCHCAELVKNDS